MYDPSFLLSLFGKHSLVLDCPIIIKVSFHLFVSDCSTNCQREHWKARHKQECDAMASSNAAIAPISINRSVHTVVDVNGHVASDISEYGFSVLNECIIMQDPDTGELFDSLSDLSTLECGLFVTDLNGSEVGGQVSAAAAASRAGP